MHKAALALLLLVVATASATPAAFEDLTFRAPAQMGPNVEVVGASWVLLTFPEGSSGKALLDLAEPVQAEEFQEAQVLLDEPTLGRYNEPVGAPSTGPQQLPGLEATLDFGAGPASLYIEAKSVSLVLQEAPSKLRLKPSTDCLLPFVGPELSQERSGRYDEFCPADPLLLFTKPDGLSNAVVRVEGVTLAEWHYAAVSCSQDPCPSGGVRDEQGGRLASANWGQRSLSFVRAMSSGGTLTFEGTAGVVLVGASTFDLGVKGTVRLPEARGSACMSCVEPDGRTFRATGDLRLANVRPEGDWIATGMSGDFESVRFDEQSIDPAQLAKVVGVGTVVAVSLAVLAKMLASLFTRVLAPERVLEHPARRKVFQAVCAAPGSTYRALMEATGLSDGGVRNHLKRLKQTGHIVSQRHGRVVVYFENHGRYDRTWRSDMVLRDPVQQRLLDWVRQNPGCHQAAAVEFARRELGLRRTPAQRRMRRLAAWGLVDVERRGRVAFYKARS